jgi:hypothetical protein
MLRATAVGRSGGYPVEFEDWIRAQLASPPASSGPGVPRRLSLRPPRPRPGHLLQAFTAGAAVAFFALGLIAGAPVPAMHILPATKAQSLPVTSLGVVPVAAPPEAPAARPTAAVPPRASHHRFDRRTDAAPRTVSRQHAASSWASSSTGQPRTEASTFSYSRPSGPTR